VGPPTLTSARAQPPHRFLKPAPRI
jgi:hypothetical protein